MHKRGHAMAALLAVAAVLAAVLAGCNSSSKGPESSATTTVRGYTPIYTAGSCPMPYQPELNVECGTVTVPENRAHPTGPQVQLAVARVKSPSPDGASSPVVRLEGGPGNGSLQRWLNKPADQGGLSANPLLADHDLILVDQRGTGFSKPNLECPERDAAIWAALGQNAPYPTELDPISTSVQACKQRLEASGIDLSTYDTVSNASDIADVKAAMGIGDWTLWGISYGTLIAQEMMRSHPQGVRGVVLDSVVPPDNTAAAQQVDSAERAFDTVFTACEQSTSCNAAYPNLRQRFDTTLASYDQNPLVVTVKDRAGKPHVVSITGAELLVGVFNTMYTTSQIPAVPSIIQLMEQRSPALQSGFEQGFWALFDSAEGTFYSVDCRDRFHETTSAELADIIKANPDFAFQYEENSIAGCPTWNTGAVDPSFNQLVSSDIPTLVLAGSYDPVMPPSGSKRVADHLAQATYVEFDGTGHGVFLTNPCANQLVVSFVANPTEVLDRSCVSTIGPPAFTTP